MTTNELRKAAMAVFLATEDEVAQDLSDKLNWAAHEIDRLKNELSVSERTVATLTNAKQQCGHNRRVIKKEVNYELLEQ